MVAATLATTLGLLLVWRGGYSQDEEITLFAVRGIVAHGIPVLPSGFTYWRGVFYSYLAALAALAGGGELPTYRLLSLACGVATVFVVGSIARAAGARAYASFFMAVWPAAVAMAVYARFYAAFLAAFALAVWLAVRGASDRRHRWWFVGLALVARTLHEFGLSLAILPFAYAACADNAKAREGLVRWGVTSAAALLVAHGILLSLSRTPAASTVFWGLDWFGLPMPMLGLSPVLQVARATDLIVLAGLLIFVGALLRPRTRADLLLTAAATLAAGALAIGLVAALAIAWVIARPSRAARTAVTAIVIAATACIGWLAIVAFRADTRLSWSVAADLVQSSLYFGWDGPRFLASQLPLASVLAAVAVVAAIRSTDAVALRALAVLFWTQLLSFSFFGVDVRLRFVALLTPVLAVLCGYSTSRLSDISEPIVAGWSRRAVGRTAGIALAAAAVSVTVLEQQRLVLRQLAPRPNPQNWAAAWLPPTALSSLDRTPRAYLADNDIVVTNDELACLLLVGRVDYWWPPDETSAERYGMVNELGRRRGIYAGAAVLRDQRAFDDVIAGRDGRRVSVVMFNTNKFGFDPGALQRSLPAGLEIETRQVPGEWFVARVGARSGFD